MRRMMVKVTVLACVAVLLGATLASGAAAKTHHERWNEMSNPQKAAFFHGVMAGIQAMGLYGGLPYEKVGSLSGFSKEYQCIKNDFDTIYSQQTEIQPAFLFLKSSAKCKGEISSEQFQQDIEKLKK